MRVSVEDHEGFYDRMSQLREMEIGLDGAICAKGGEVRVHLPYIAACNQTLFNRITGLIKQDKKELNVKNMSLQGIQLIVDYCYSGKVELTQDNFEHVADAALGLEFLNIIEKCVQFAVESKANANMWCQFLQLAFKHPQSIQPKHFMPNLILESIAVIPKEAILKELDAVYIREMLEHGSLSDNNRSYAVNVFLEMILASKEEIKTYEDTIRRMRDIVKPKDKLYIPEHTPDAAVISLVELGLQLNFTLLVGACTKMMQTTQPTRHVTSLALKWSNKYAGSDSVKFINQYIFHAFSNLPLDISEEDLCAMLESDCLGQMSELIILKTGLKWLRQNNASAESNQRVFGLIRFGLMTKEEVEIVIKDHSIVGCEKMLFSAIKYHLSPHDQPLGEGIMNKIRLGAPIIYVMGGKDELGNYNKHILRAEVCDNESSDKVLGPFTVEFETPFSLTFSACTELNGFIFVCGGEGEQGTVSSLFRFDPRTNTWMELEKMKTNRKNHSLTAIHANLIAVGGNGGAKTFDSVEMYDIRNNMWTFMESLPEGLSQHAASCVDGVLYISGGSGAKTLFSFSDEEWDRKSPMLHTRQCHVMTGFSGMLIVAGGAANVSKKCINAGSTECYDITQDQWTELSPPKKPCSLGSSVRVNNWFYVIGGYNFGQKTRLDTIQRYDIQTNEWELCDSKLPSTMSKLSAACTSIQLSARAMLPMLYY